jgi:hypothetical protein
MPTEEETQLLSQNNDDNKICKMIQTIFIITSFILILCVVIIVPILVSCYYKNPNLSSCDQYHNKFGPVIQVHNNCSEEFIVFFSNFNDKLIGINSTIVYNLTSNSNGVVYALSSLITESPYTQFIFNFNEVYDGIFSISLKNDYNIPINFKLFDFIGTGSNTYYNDMIYPTWSHEITEEMCPLKLRKYNLMNPHLIIQDSFMKYIGCSNPCSVFNDSYYCCTDKYQCYNKYCEPNENKCIETWCDGRDWNNYSTPFINACDKCEFTNCPTNTNYMANYPDGYVDECQLVVYSTYKLTLCGIN